MEELLERIKALELRRVRDGAPGRCPTITIGSITTGTFPTVTNSGTATDVVLDFVFPEGRMGPQGPVCGCNCKNIVGPKHELPPPKKPRAKKIKVEDPDAKRKKEIEVAKKLVADKKIKKK